MPAENLVHHDAVHAVDGERRHAGGAVALLAVAPALPLALWAVPGGLGDDGVQAEDVARLGLGPEDVEGGDLVHAAAGVLFLCSLRRPEGEVLQQGGGLGLFTQVSHVQPASD